MVRIRFVVKRADFAISAASIQRLGFGERLIGFETEHWKAPLPREILQTMQDALTNPEAARGWRHPHALDFAVGCMALQRATSDGFALQHGQKEEPVRRREVLGGRRDAALRVEAGFEARGELLEVASDAVLGGTAPGILEAQADGAGVEEVLDRLHRRDQGAAL